MGKLSDAKRGRGRPSKGLAARLALKVRPQDKAAWVVAAAAEGLELSEWVRARCNAGSDWVRRDSTASITGGNQSITKTTPLVP